MLKEAEQLYGDRRQQRRRRWRRAMPIVASCQGSIFLKTSISPASGFRNALGQTFPGKRKLFF